MKKLSVYSTGNGDGKSSEEEQWPPYLSYISDGTGWLFQPSYFPCFYRMCWYLAFQVAYDPGNKSKPIAVRIRKLPKGSIRQDQLVSSHTLTGVVIQVILTVLPV